MALIGLERHGSRTTKMSADKDAPNIELGMKVSVQSSNQNRIGVVVRRQGDYVIVRWTNSDLGETAEYHAHRDDVTSLAGWLRGDAAGAGKLDACGRFRCSPSC
jgi:hypothetical protein